MYWGFQVTLELSAKDMPKNESNHIQSYRLGSQMKPTFNYYNLMKIGNTIYIKTCRIANSYYFMASIMILDEVFY